MRKGNMTEHIYNPGELIDEVMEDCQHRYLAVSKDLGVILIDETVSAAKAQRMGIPIPSRVIPSSEVLSTPPRLAIVEDREFDA